MEITGHIHDGVVVLDNPLSLPEGAGVVVILQNQPRVQASEHSTRVEFPLVPSSHPGTVQLTNERIGEVLDEEDASS